MITVVGSANVDIVAEADVFPNQGETVRGSSFQTTPGGKGANQAVACARLGEEVQLIGTVGSDLFSETIIKNLKEQLVDTTYVEQVSGPSGVAVILLTAGDNRIISIPGANHSLTVERINAARDVFRNSTIVMLQLEIPTEVVWCVLHICKEFQVPVIMDPAPATSFCHDFLPYIRYVTPNETECQQIFGTSMEEAIKQYPNKLLVTLGKEGVRYHDGKQQIHIPAVEAHVVDTTGAGDTFNGALAAQLHRQKSLFQALQFATVAAALSVEKFGAQGGMPTNKEVQAKLT
ncbi:ribokinase [Sporosarcina sp. PTS2304]|uniref:ribokinase n=1 Tax=Sporosarcina sp. PTS2304 TaxID=2283194 RepID=UPI000E0D146D|nr:ribokinase [Sporosarcina sp. PTS2304]AXH98309.1 ribokinase [Sporosarcina sp. PTS2304]